jgi:hypothetical protein
MNLDDVGTAVLALIAFLGAVGAVAAWFYKRGSAEAKLTDAVDANTAATEKLTQHLSKVGDKLNEHDVQLADHDARLRAGGL